MVLDVMQRAVQVYACFLVNGNPIGAGFGKDRDKFIRVFDHQVAVERQFRCSSQGLNYWWADSEVGHEVSIHDVDVNDGSSALGGGSYLLAQASEISRKNRRCQFDQQGLRTCGCKETLV